MADDTVIGSPTVTTPADAPAGALGGAAPIDAPHGTSPAPTPEPVKEPVIAATPPIGGSPKPDVTPTRTAADISADPKPGDPSVPEPVKEFPEDWRQKLAGDDKKLLARLERMKDPKDLLNAYRALETDLSSGKFAKKLPTHYTAEELADYRKANNIPDKPEGYDDNLGNGIVWGENDKPHIDNFKAYALEHNMTPDEVKRGLGWWATYQEQLVNDMNESDSNNAALAINEYKASWGVNTQRNFNFMKNVFEANPGSWAKFIGSRAPDGRLIGDSPDLMNIVFERLKDADPEALDSVLPGRGGAPAQSLDQEMKDISALMGDKSSKYWRGPESSAIQARYRELIERSERAKTRAA